MEIKVQYSRRVAFFTKVFTVLPLGQMGAGLPFLITKQA